MQKLKSFIPLFIAMIMFSCLLFMKCEGQIYTFTNRSKAIKIGTFATTNAYTFTFGFKADTGTHVMRSVPLWECGNQKAYFSWPYLIYNNFQILLDGKSDGPHWWMVIFIKSLSGSVMVCRSF